MGDPVATGIDAGGPGRALAAPRVDRAAYGSDGDLAPPRRSPPPAQKASQTPPSGHVGRRHPGLHTQAGDRGRDAAAPDLRAPIGRAGPARELPIIYILMLVIAIFWRRAVLGSEDLTLYQFDVVIILALVGMIALLWSRWPIPLAWLKALELGMIGILAIRVAITQYRLMLLYSLRGDRMMAELTMKNVVLLISILILTYGLYVPKSWRRAALVVGPLALLPFATLMVLILQYPDAMAWLWQGWRLSKTATHPPVPLRRDDLAHARRRLDIRGPHALPAAPASRRARQFGQYRLRRRLGAGGMGEVFLAEHELLKRPCAVKLIRTDARPTREPSSGSSARCG